ncbi:hypothetical protein BC941DRAFT_424165 [Chlamydoabsidia padenii]|nr:hypothetical protein BC941DRAFT_424165 [Chlamydoabsidia padenii]
MASPDPKRRWTESNPPTIPSRPPLKKRFTSNINISTTIATSSSSSTSPSSGSPLVGPPSASSSSNPTILSPPVKRPSSRPLLKHPEKILVKSLSKNGWLKRMQEAKLDYRKLESEQVALESDYIHIEASKGLIRVQLNMIQQDLILVAKSKGIVDITMQSDIHKETGKAEREWISRTHSMAKELQIAILDQVKSWTKGAQTLEKQWQQGLEPSQKHTLLSDWLLAEMEDLRASYQQEQAYLRALKQDNQFLSQQYDDKTKDAQSCSDQLQRTMLELDDCTTMLMQAEKRHDRSKSQVVASLANGGLGGLTVDALDETPLATPTITAETTFVGPMTPAVTSSAPVTARGYSGSDVVPGSIVDQTLKSQLSEHQLIIDTRNKEISQLKQERQSLVTELDRLELQFGAHLPEERLINTDHYKNLQTSYEYYRNRAHHQDQMRTSLERTLDDLDRARKRWMEELKAEKLVQSTTMETEMKRLENDLARIRTQKDQFKAQYDDQVAKELGLKEANQQVIQSAENEKEYITSLEYRLQDLKSDTTVAGPLAQDLASFNEFRTSTQRTKYILERLDEMTKRQWNRMESQQLVASMKERIHLMQSQLEGWKSHGDQEQQDQVKVLMADLADYSTESRKLSLMIDLFERTESQLLNEIDRMASIYGRLEEQRSKKVFEEDYKPEHRLKLVAEKSKFAQTFPSLIAAKEKQLANVISLRLTSDKQKDLIVQHKEREKSLELQLSGKDNDNWRMVQSVEDDKSMVETLTQQLEESKNTLERLDSHVLELQQGLKEKTRALEEEKHLQVGVEEDYDKMKRKWDMISHGDQPLEQLQLAEECEELRSLLKCGTCRTRFRSHLLTRCMHTFCKKCIDARLETRQRRCPICSESFGASDVRQFYL